MRSRGLSASVALLLTLASQPLPGQSQGPKPAAAPRYALTQLPLYPTGINDSGQVSGTSGSFHAALWTKQGGLREISLPAGFTRAEGLGINQKGELIGVAISALSNQRQGFEFADGKLTLLSGRQSKPFGINDAGQIAGETILGNDGISGAVLWDGDVVMDLGGCCGGTAIAVNNHGEAIANIYDRQGQYQAFVWTQKDGLQHIAPSGSFSSALLINDAGHVVIEPFSKSILLFEDGKFTKLELSPKYPSRPRAINNANVIVGSAGPFADSDHAFIWDKEHGYRDLNDLIAPGSGWVLRAASAINEKGEIVGWGDLRGEENVGFLLTPLP
ncbi:MAG: hypothetical protein WA655_11810 [Candidatus Korobacteraceae bacterium]